MNFFEEFNSYLNQNTSQDIHEMRQLRKGLQKTLSFLDEKLDSITFKRHSIKERCPQCNSSHIKGHGSKPVTRFQCLDCNFSFVKHRSPLYFRKRHPYKILDLVVAIYITEKSTTQIIEELDISSQTYYKWKKLILHIFPQLEEKFIWRGKKTAKL